MIAYDESVASGAEKGKGEAGRDKSLLFGILFLWAIVLSAMLGSLDIASWFA